MGDLSIPNVRLNDGNEIPQLGVGVFLVEPGVTDRIVSDALEVGYRHIDTASAYHNEAEVGAAIEASGIARDELFITTKLWNNDQERPHEAFDASLDRLGLEKVDLYLVHWPVPTQNTYVGAWRGLVEILGSGRTDSIGVSNFEVDHLQRLLDETGVVPAVNQIEVHPLHQRRELREFCREHGIAVEAWGPLAQGQGGLLELDTIVDTAAAHGKTPAQVVLRWHVQHGNIIFPKTLKRARMVENAQLFDFELTATEMAAIDALDAQQNFGPDPRTFTGK